MDGCVTWKCPVDPAVLDAAFRVLQEHQLLVGSFDYSQEKTYDVSTYLLQQALHRTDFCILIDRNLFSVAKAFALGKGLAERSRVQLGALMVVAMAHNMTFEPCIAVCEYADRHGNAAAYRDLQIFRHADNLPLKIYIDLLLRRLDRLPVPHCFKDAHGSVPDEHDLTVPLKTWNFNYPLLLKIAQLERAPLKPDERMAAYLDWMWSDYIFSGPATAFGVMFLSPGLRAQPRSQLEHQGNPSSYSVSATASTTGAEWLGIPVRDHRRVLKSERIRDSSLFLRKQRPRTRIVDRTKPLHTDRETAPLVPRSAVPGR